MKAILISINPKWVAKILNSEKTLEIRKKMPKCDLPIDVYIYCTKITRNKSAVPYIWEGKVVAKFTLNEVEEIIIEPFGEEYKQYELEWCNKSCLSFSELNKYLKGKIGYAWHIDNLVPFDKPKELKDFYKVGCEEYFTKHVFVDHPNFRPVYERELKQFQFTRAPQSFMFIEV